MSIVSPVPPMIQLASPGEKTSRYSGERETIGGRRTTRERDGIVVLCRIAQIYTHSDCLLDGYGKLEYIEAVHYIHSERERERKRGKILRRCCCAGLAPGIQLTAPPAHPLLFPISAPASKANLDNKGTQEERGPTIQTRLSINMCVL